VVILEALVAGLVAVAWPVRAWRRHQRGAGPAPARVYIAETAALTATLAALLWRRGVPLDALGLRVDSAARFVADTAICLAVVVGLDLWLTWRLMRRIREIAPSLGEDRVFGDTLSHRPALGSFAAVAIVGATWEELCFRAVVFLLMPATAIGRLIGTVVGSALFGAQHLRNGRQGFSYAAGFGVLFSVLYLVTGDLVAVILSHAIGNILAVAQWTPWVERARARALGGA
jgi:membrane protease YdiL (CAAX protease family)